MSARVVEFTPGGKPVRHGGSGTAYANYGCRCDECKAANTSRTKRRRNERMPDKAPEGSHGSASTYANWRCRCSDCKAAHARMLHIAYMKRKARRA